MLAVLFVFPGMAVAEKNMTIAHAVLGDDGIQRLEIVAGSYFFEPNHIIVKPGIPVELSIKRESKVVPHDFVLKIEASGIDIKEKIRTKGTLIRFTPNVAGEFPFYCSHKLLFLKSHRDKGMEGVLEVVAATP
jgi:plastocyanin